MIRKLYFVPVIALLFSSVNPVFCQKSNIHIVDVEKAPIQYALFPEKAEETSGLIWFEDALWTFNDSGGDPELYKIDSLGKITQTIVLEKAKNHDWEDITQDDQYIYVGDFGNNLGNRTNLMIYKIDKEKIEPDEKITIEASPLNISFADQTDFTIRNRKHNFDCESMINYGDSLILFSKDWGDGKTRMYKTAKVTGRYPLEPVAEFNADGLVTGASYNPDNGKLALIGYKNFVPFIWIFENFDGKSFNAENITRYNLMGITNSQTEGICWMDDDTLLVSTEQRDEFQQGAFILKLSDLAELTGRK